MAFRFLRTLGERLAYPFVRLSERLGRATRQIGQALSRVGVALETSSIRRIENAIEESRLKTERILGRPATEVIDPDFMSEAITRQRRQYAWTIRTGLVDPVTGARIDKYITISTDRLLSAQEAIDQAHNVLEADYGFHGANVISSDIVSVTKAGSLGTL